MIKEQRTVIPGSMGSECFDIPGFEAFVGMTRWIEEESPRIKGEGMHEKDLYAF
ncbi:MAG: hypothetical protein ABSA71_00200 [Desulfomonilia bacterium]|jgi:hypothetical protein